MANFDIRNRVALVTGGATGIGFGVAKGLAQAGAVVVVAGRRLDKAREAAEELKGSGAKAEAIALDVTQKSDIDREFGAVAARHGRLDILVTSAGTNRRLPTLEYDEASWDAVIDTNLKGPLLCAQPFVRRRVAAGGGGAIVNIASTAAFSARAGAGHYCASKAGLVMLTKCMAMEFGPHRIRVNAVAPGLIDVEGERVSADYKRNFLPMIPYGRLGLPPDVARAVAFLASDAADFITGTVLPVDGGFLTGRPLMRAGST